MQVKGVVTEDEIGEFLRTKVEKLIEETSKGRAKDPPKLPNRCQSEIIMTYHMLVFRLQGYDLKTEDKYEAEITLTSKKLVNVRQKRSLYIILQFPLPSY